MTNILDIKESSFICINVSRIAKKISKITFKLGIRVHVGSYKFISPLTMKIFCLPALILVLLLKLVLLLQIQILDQFLCFFKYIYLFIFIYFWPCRVFVAAVGFL